MIYYFKYTEEGQNVVDLAIQEYGTAKAIFIVIDDNADAITSLDGTIPPGSYFKYRSSPESDLIDSDIMNHFRDNEIKVSSGHA